MCGIAGTFAYGRSARPVDPAALRRMVERLRARGPDGEGEYLSADGRLGLCHRRLAIIDLTEGGAQPMRDPESGAQIVFNGEIYNFRELRAWLVGRGHVFRSESDTEVLLKLYAEKGPAMLSMLRGMFAFAIWDDKRQAIFVARDPFGMKPLYFADDGGTFRFASQAKALLASGEVETAADPAGAVGFLLFGHVPEPFTMHRSIRSLPAGSSMWVDRNGMRAAETYYDLARRIEGLEPLSVQIKEEEARELLAEALRDSMRHHLVADVPVGLFLSGGIDSGVLLALMCETGTQQPQTFTLGFREFAGGPRDETQCAQYVSDFYKAKHTERYVSHDEFRQNFSHLIDAMDVPSIDGVNAYFVCKSASSAGLKVALSGVGGDELFAGYSDFLFIPKTVRALALFGDTSALGVFIRRLAAPLAGRITSPKYASLIEYGQSVESAYFLSRALFLPWELNAILEPSELKRGLEALNLDHALHQATPDIPNPRVQLSSLFGSLYMRNQLLRDADWASMAHSLELRLPLVDVPLWETVLQLELSGHSVGKQDLSLSPKHELPASLRGRPKMGFHVPVREWLLDDNDVASGERGLRGWARIVNSRYAAGPVVEHAEAPLAPLPGS